MNDKLTLALREAARLADETAKALSQGDIDAAARLQREAEMAWQKARRLGKRHTTRPTLSRVPSVRERAISALTELNVSSSPKLIAAYSEARSGEPFDVRAIASIRRDEHRSWTSGSRRDTYLVPALEGPWFAAGRGRFALSHWPLWQRINGPLSPRADHLKVCLRLVDQVESLDRKRDAAARMCKLLAEYARTVPGALDNAWDSGADVNIVRIRKAIAAELNLVQDEDENWRKHEAERATRTLDDVQQIWGGTMPQIITDKPG
jgi:hypothetical protein